MNLSFDPRQLGTGFVAGLLMAPALQAALAHAHASSNWPAALVVGGLGLGAAAVAGNGRPKVAPTEALTSEFDAPPPLTPLEFARSRGASGEDDFAIATIFELSFQHQVKKAIWGSLFVALNAALHAASEGDHQLLKRLEEAYRRLGGDERAFKIHLETFVAENPDSRSEDDRARLKQAHAFPITRLMALFASSGTSTSQIRWLKGFDRELFYAFNNIGRATFHVEGAGPIAHFLAERDQGGAITTPSVQWAVDTAIAAASSTAEARGRLAPLRKAQEPQASPTVPLPSLQQ